VTEPQASPDLQRLQAIIEGTRAGTWEWNAASGSIRVNERWAEMLGYALEELKPLTIEVWRRLCHPDDLAKSNGVFKRHFKGQLPYYECVVRLRHKEGHWVWIQDRGRLISRTETGEPEWVVGTHTDISEQYLNTQMLNKLAETVPGVIYMFRMWPDGSYELPYVSEGITDLYGAGPDEVQAQSSLVFERVHPDDLAGLLESIQLSYQQLSQWNYEYRVVVEGKQLWLQGVATPESEGEGIVTWYGLVVDVSHRKALEQKLVKLSVTDELTGLYNRRYLFERLTDLLEEKRRHQVPFSLVQVDLDWFKSINDTYGHLMGDEVLKAFSSTLRQRLRRGDIAGRTGGEEFLILLPHTDARAAAELIEVIREVFMQTQFQSDAQELFQVSFSAGITSVRDRDKQLDDLLARADAALYRAKRLGRNQVVIDSSPLGADK